ncbi:hypothetical protein L917_02018 [Phytophthora nicotianae]|uniref:Transmembrane protein n=3 Tax=Phytophthora nicotianae TaxID=4792 RepID=W2QP73_PHYN3|nr:hypothetical protein PPTG_07043 [Phytophthora nicotianae INRA-310]ETI55071.1 hypothetical protein F443_02207 [Phytophthora nicotianae P1569]ETM01378.1 hypothetical protein L917_02018 [Phytophthora nicotianae]ETN14761.1 hypothetical protein PPTG_07043 [Phytophthora nicotianae INRA-310]
MVANTRWRMVLSLMNGTVASVDALHLVILANVDTTKASTSQTTQRQLGLLVLSFSMLLSLSCVLSVWLIPKRSVGCSMVVNALVFLLHALVFLPLSVMILIDGHRVLGLIELAFVVAMVAGCVSCRIYSVRMRDEVDRNDALEISYEQLKMEQVAASVAAGC